MSGDVGDRLEEVRGRIAAAAARSGRAPGAVRLVAVSKGVAAPQIVEAVAAGAVDLGESRAQELLAKAPALADRPVRWHFVGRLQRNKVGPIARWVSMWQSVDRPELGEVIARRAPGAEVLVEVNISEDPFKGGCAPAVAPALVENLRAAGLTVSGLMAVPALGPDPRPAFARLRELAGRLELAELSMGMSGDFEAAVEEGATMVRIGRAVFGPRPTPPRVSR